MSAQELINAWGRKKYPAYANAKTFTLEAEKRSDGYCETCWNEYAAVIVYADYKEVAELGSTSIANIINEILAAAE